MIAAITGANGFIGQHLIHGFVAAGWTVRSIVRQDFRSGHAEDLLAGSDVLIHAAGATRAPNVAELRESNVSLTARVTEIAAARNVKRLILISSQAAAGPARTLGEPVTEEIPASPVEAYGASKLDAESVVTTQTSIAWVVLRPSAVYGPADRDFLSLFWLAKRGVAIHPANRDHWLSIVHVSDLVDVVLRCATADAAVSRTYFVADDAPVQWAELFRMGAECAGTALRMDITLPMSVVHAGALLGDLAAHSTGHATLMTSGKVALSRERFWVCSNERAKRELSWTPRVGLQAGMREAYDWYVSHGRL